MRKIPVAIWNYIKEMNRGTNGNISINRSMAWGIATAWVVIQMWAMYVIPHTSDTEIERYINMSIVFVSIDAVFVVLALGITSIEKITELAQKLKFGIFGGQPPERTPPPPEPPIENKPLVTVTTEVTTNKEP